MTRKEIMADGPLTSPEAISTTTITSPDQQGGSAVTGSGNINLPPLVSGEAKEPVPSEPRMDILRRIFGGNSMPAPAVSQATQETTHPIPDQNTGQIPEPSPPSGEPPDGGGGDGGNGGEAGVPPPPPEAENREIDISPEKGRWLADEIIRFRTTMTYQERYNEVNGPIYAQRLQKCQEYVNEICRLRNDRVDFGPQKAYPRPTQPRNPNGSFVPPQFPDPPQSVQDLLQTMAQLRKQYSLQGAEESGQEVNPNLLPLPATIETSADLQVAFQHARNHSLLREVDTVLRSIYQELTITVSRERGVVTGSTEDMLELRIARTKRLAQTIFNERRQEDGDIPEQLSAIVGLYIDLAHRRIERAINGQSQVDYRDGEWRAPSREQTDKESKNTFWETTGYIKYYRVTAQTREQFLTAKDTFFSMIRAGRLGKSPGALFEHVKNFIEAFALQGEQQIGKTVDGDFIKETRLQLEALLYVLVGSYAGEVYDYKQRHGAMDAMAKDEGSQRWTALYRANEGRVAVFTHMFDKEMLMDIFNNPMAERGELDLVAGHFLQDRIQEKAIEKGMGIVLKDYDSREEYFSSDDLQAKIDAAAELELIKAEIERTERAINTGVLRRLKPEETVFDRMYEGDELAQTRRERAKFRINAQESNLQCIGLTKNVEEFKSLFEGFENGDYHIKNYLRFAEDQVRAKGERQYTSLDRLPESIRKSIDLGRIQVELRRIRQYIIDNHDSVRPGLERGQTALDFLSQRDRQIYEAAYVEAAGNFEIAFEMQGALGEKARRGRGYLMVEKNDNVRYFYDVADSLRLQWIDEIKKEGIRDIMVYMSENFTDLISSLEPEEQALQSIGKAEFDKFFQSLTLQQKTALKKGWMLASIEDGKPLDTFNQEYQDLYRSLSPKERLVYRDNIATYQAENLVQWGIFYTKMKYADKSAKFRKQKVEQIRKSLVEEVRTKGYDASLLDDEGNPMVFKRPLGIFDATGQFKKIQLGDRLGFNAAGQEILLALDQEGRIQNLQYDQAGKAIMFDKASGLGKKRVNAHIANTSKVTLVEGTLVENVKSTFEIAALSDDFRNRYIDHTYLYYQGNIKDTILTPHIEQAAWRIWKGISRPGDEDKLALQRVLADPTMRRIRKVDNDKGQKREKFLIAGAILESVQGAMRTRKATYKAYTSADGNHDRMMAGYRQEDWAGYDRFTFGYAEFAAEQTSRLARRLAAGIWMAPFEHDSGPARWGVHGIGEGIEMMADEIGKYAHQRHIGQFALTKINDVLLEAVNMYHAWVGDYDPQTGEWVFGLAEKPTDNNESQNKYVKESLEGKITAEPEKGIEFFYDLLKTFGRLKKVTKTQRHMYTDIDNSAGAVDLEDQEVILPDGRFNTTLFSILRNVLGENGTARARQKELLEDYDKWLLDERPGGGGDVYRRDLWWNKYLKARFKIYQGGKRYKEGSTFSSLRNEKII